MLYEVITITAVHQRHGLYGGTHRMQGNFIPPGVVGAETIGEKLKLLAEDRSVAAVVLRINSPGGEVFAAERIRREVQALRNNFV